MQTPKIVDEFCTKVKQLDINFYVSLIDDGKEVEAFIKIKRAEGHWLSDGDIAIIIDYINDTK